VAPISPSGTPPANGPCPITAVIGPCLHSGTRRGLTLFAGGTGVLHNNRYAKFRRFSTTTQLIPPTLAPASRRPDAASGSLVMPGQSIPASSPRLRRSDHAPPHKDLQGIGFASSPTQLMRGRSRSAPPCPLAMGVGPLPPALFSLAPLKSRLHPHAGLRGGPMLSIGPNYFPHHTHPGGGHGQASRARMWDGRDGGPPSPGLASEKEKAKTGGGWGCGWWWRALVHRSKAAGGRPLALKPRGAEDGLGPAHLTCHPSAMKKKKGTSCPPFVAIIFDRYL